MGSLAQRLSQFGLSTNTRIVADLLHVRQLAIKRHSPVHVWRTSQHHNSSFICLQKRTRFWKFSSANIILCRCYQRGSVIERATFRLRGEGGKQTLIGASFRMQSINILADFISSLRTQTEKMTLLRNTISKQKTNLELHFLLQIFKRLS